MKVAGGLGYWGIMYSTKVCLGAAPDGQKHPEIDEMGLTCFW